MQWLAIQPFKVRCNSIYTILGSYLGKPPASLPEMQWLAIIVFAISNLFKSDFDGMKGKIGLWFTQLIRFKQLANQIE